MESTVLNTDYPESDKIVLELYYHGFPVMVSPEETPLKSVAMIPAPVYQSALNLHRANIALLNSMVVNFYCAISAATVPSFNSACRKVFESRMNRRH